MVRGGAEADPSHEGSFVLSDQADLSINSWEGYIGSACQPCIRTCMRVHGIFRSRTSLRPPCFYISVDEHSICGGQQCWMTVPEAFIHRYLPNVDRQIMILENVDGWKWPVMFSGDGFDYGWREFSNDNSLVIGDTLFFSLVEMQRFTVHVFSTSSGCEKSAAVIQAPSNKVLRPRRGAEIEQRIHPMQTLQGLGRFPKDRPKEQLEEPRNLSFGSCYEQREGRVGIPSGELHENVGAHLRHLDHSSKDSLVLLQNAVRETPISKATSSETYERRKATRTGNIHPLPFRTGMTDSEVGSLEVGKRERISTAVETKQGVLRGHQSPKWRQTQARGLARVLAEKAKLHKINLTDLPVHGNISKGTKNPLNKESIISKSPRAQSLQSSYYIEESSCSDSDGGAIYGSNEGRSLGLLQRGSYCRDSHNSVSEKEEEDTHASLQNLSHTATGKTIIADEIQNYRGSNDVDLDDFFAEDFPTLTDHLHQQKQKRLKNHSQNAPTRKRGRPRKYPINEAQLQGTPIKVMTHAQGEKAEPLAKRKRGRPFKYQVLPQDFTSLNGPSRSMRDIFISRRRPVTQAEKDNTLTAAHSFASGIKSTNIVIVMRHSFVYRNFVMGMPRKFGQRYMPPGNMEARVCDMGWKVWLCSWNAVYGYLSGRGWRNFALDHCLEEDDTIVFEVISESKTTVTLMAHIFRVLAIPDGITGWQSHICPPDCFPDAHSGLLIRPIPRTKLATQQEQDFYLEGSAMTDSLRS